MGSGGHLASGLLWGGAGCYVLAALGELHGRLARRRIPLLVSLAWAVGVGLLGLAIVERWLRLGHGPFLTLFEVLLSNLFSLGLLAGLIFWRAPATRPGVLVALCLLALLAIWSLLASDHDSRLPPTYQNPWLWAHVAAGKLFLGVCLVATGGAGALLLRRSRLVGARLAREGGDETLDRSAWSCLAVAFVFHSLMLITGAIWAQDAWGRYWAWDPLETWAFATWLAMATLLHLRATLPLPAWLGWWGIVGVFGLAFLTFFGVPFLSQAPHKGAV